MCTVWLAMAIATISRYPSHHRFLYQCDNDLHCPVAYFDKIGNPMNNYPYFKIIDKRDDKHRYSVVN